MTATDTGTSAVEKPGWSSSVLGFFGDGVNSDNVNWLVHLELIELDLAMCGAEIERSRESQKRQLAASLQENNEEIRAVKAECQSLKVLWCCHTHRQNGKLHPTSSDFMMEMNWALSCVPA